MGEGIDLCLIAPIGQLELMNYGDMYFALADLVLKYPAYAKYINERQRSYYTIMDNGAYELGKSMDIDAIMKTAKMIHADEIIAPDYPMHAQETLDMTKEFFEVISKEERKKYIIQVVPHGRTPLEYITCWERFMLQSEFNHAIDVIGISVLFDRVYPRTKVLQYMNMATPHLLDVTMHLLGFDDIYEFFSLPKRIHGRFRSIDMSFPFTLAKHQMLVEDPDMVHYSPEVYDLKRVDLEKDCVDTFWVRQTVENMRKYIKYADFNR